MRWLANGERELEGASGSGFLQGILLSEVSRPMYTTATERRIVMFEDVVDGRRGRVRATGISFEVPWSMVAGYWTGVMPFPPDMWREGPEGEVIVLTLDPAAADGRDLVVWPLKEAWVLASQAMGVPRVRD